MCAQFKNTFMLMYSIQIDTIFIAVLRSNCLKQCFSCEPQRVCKTRVFRSWKNQVYSAHLFNSPQPLKFWSVNNQIDWIVQRNETIYNITDFAKLKKTSWNSRRDFSKLLSMHALHAKCRNLLLCANSDHIWQTD